MSRLTQRRHKRAIKTEMSDAWMALSGDEIVEEREIGDYEVFLLKSGQVSGIYSIGLQRKGEDAFNPIIQQTKIPNSRGGGSLLELKHTIQEWTNKYGELMVGTENPDRLKQYMRLIKRLGLNLGERTVLGTTYPVIKKGSLLKIRTTTVTPKGPRPELDDNGALLSVIVDNGERPRVTIRVSLGIQTLPEFSITIPVDMFEPDSDEVEDYARQALEALIRDISANLLVIGYPEQTIIAVSMAIESAFLGLRAENASDAYLPMADPAIRMYEVAFAVPIRSKVASCVRRSPVQRDIQLTPIEEYVSPGTPADVIDFYFGQAPMRTPVPFEVKISERAAPTKAKDWQARRVIE